MSRLQVVAAFIAGAALVATIVLVASPGRVPNHTLAEKMVMLKRFRALAALSADKGAAGIQALEKPANLFQALAVDCSNLGGVQAIAASGRCPGTHPWTMVFRDGCC